VQLGGPKAIDLTMLADLVASRLVPTGALSAYLGTTAPTGWELCYGQSVLRTGIYADLFALIGTLFGAVDGTHFNIPDLRGRAPLTLDNLGGSDAGILTMANTLGLTGGAEKHLLLAAESGEPGHNHAFTGTAGNTGTENTNHSHNGGTANAAAGGSFTALTTNAGGLGPQSNNVNHYHGFTPAGNNTAAPAANAASSHNNLAPYMLTGYIVKL
jgi:microcystin-dependent protein